MLRKILLAVLVLLLLVALGFGIWLSQANNYQAEGTIQLDVLDKPVRVLRDSAGVPYIYAENFADALRAQGFVSAQDRLFQLVFTQHLVTGRLAELIGPAGVEQDTKMRVLGVPRHGRVHAALLGEKSRRHLELYLQGLNAYIAQMQAEQPLGLTVMGIEAQPWTLEESVALRYFLSWASTPNMDAELISLQLIDKLGLERAQAISQMSRNTDVGLSVAAEYGQTLLSSVARNDVVLKDRNQRTDSFAGGLADKFALGSNHWVVDGSLTESGRPLLVNNPHIDTRSLPGTWHPLGIITPDFRAVGVAGPGTVGLAIARTEHVAYGVTNSYGDGIDLFIETADPDNPEHYLEQGRSVPYEIIEEVMRVRDFQNGGFSEQPLRIRLTRRGPVISDHGMTPDDGRIITARWAAPEYMAPDLGELGPMRANSVQEAGDEIAHINAPYNYVVIDSENNIGHFTAGRVPVRKNGDGSLPLPADIAVDNWDGLIAAKDMPGVINPARGWIGNANNRTLPADYPYAYSTYFAHTWRYERMLQLLDNRQVRGPADHWAMMLDTTNTLAERITPLMLTSLKDKEEFADLSAYLSGWGYADDADEIAPTVFQSVWHHFVRRVFSDELGPELATEMLGNYYYWEERLWSFVQAGESVWFDDINTTMVETMQDQFVLAARDARVELTEKLGPDSSQWQWGKLHTVTFFSPIAPGDVAAKWLGGGTFPKEGSGETLNRGKYKFSEPYRSVYIDSMRFVADMNDDEKVWAVLSGGTSGRQFDPHLKDQMAVWLTGEPNYWWFSDAAIREHAVSELELAP